MDEWEFWANAIRDGNEGILLAILLPLLPNLVALSVEANASRIGQYESNWYESVIERIGSATKPTLCKLAHIQLNPRAEAGYNLATIQKFSALSSVRIIKAPMAFGLECLGDIAPDMNSNVTHLKLWESFVDPKALYEFLGGFPKLQSFMYSYVERIYFTPYNDAFMIRSSLLAHCKTTLQSLTLLAPDCRHAPFMGSLKGFEALKEVYVEWPFLISETPNSRGPQLNEHLPASLVWLKIHDNQGRAKLKYGKVIKSAQYAKEHRLQKLKWLIFGGIRVRLSLETVDRDLRKTCLNMGITLIFSPYAPKSGD